MNVKAIGKLTTRKPNKNDKKEPCRFPPENCPLRDEISSEQILESLNLVSYKRSLQSRIVESLIMDLKTIISLYLTEEYDAEKFFEELNVIEKSLKALICPGQTRLEIEKANILLLKNVVDSLRKERDDFTIPEKSKSIDKKSR